MAKRQEAPQPSIATPEEVLTVFTAMLRGEKGEKPAEQMKAAENLARHYGILAPKEEKSPFRPEVAEEIEAAMRSLEGTRDG